MGFPEIVDVARNFAVMVRVQGPDPKGLKMRNYAFHHYNSGNTALSASGMLLPGSLCNASTVKRVGNESGAQKPVMDAVLVLTVASVLEPFLSQEHRENFTKDNPELIPGVQIDILVEGKGSEDNDDQGATGEPPLWMPAELVKMVTIPVSSTAVQSLTEASAGSSENGWEVGWSLASYGSKRYPTVETFQTQVEQSPFQNRNQMVRLDSSNLKAMGKSTTRIAFLKVPSKYLKDLPELSTSAASKRGDLILAMGSPFGILSTLHFFNCISVGSVANIYPPDSLNKSLLLADIRCLPGMEGSPVFGEGGHLIGILVRPLRQRNTGSEIQMVIPWNAIASSCSDLLQEEPYMRGKEIRYKNGNIDAVGKISVEGLRLSESSSHMHEYIHSGSIVPSPIEKAMKSVCLITIDNGAWASGVLLNKNGLVLTNAHLLEPWRFGKATATGESNEAKSNLDYLVPTEAVPLEQLSLGVERTQNMLTAGQRTADLLVGDNYLGSKSNLININHRSIRIRLDCLDPWMWSNAKVLYVSKGPLDIALLQLEFIPEQLSPIVMDFTCPSPGSKAYVIGHGLFGPRFDFLPSACLGVVAKVVEAKISSLQQSSVQMNAQGRLPAMLETTAAVHPGGSGGAVVNLDGRMIGLVTSNARHGGGTVIPHLNFSIPCAVLEPVYKFSEGMLGLSILEDLLDRPNEHLSSAWELVPPLSPKPGPLPNLPQFQLEVREKDMKGSQFAKFIAERRDLLKETAELGKNKMLPSKLSHSKL